MAISPPSDLVLDVVRAADPIDVQAAQARLKTSRAAFAATSLAEGGVTRIPLGAVIGSASQ